MRQFIFLALLAATAEAKQAPLTAVALVRGTAEGSAVAGSVRFTQTGDGLEFVGKLSGLPAGQHGFHIHENGLCSDAGKDAGGHYNPHDAPHGQALKDGPKKAHAGDLGNVVAREDGTAVVSGKIAKLTLSGGRRWVAGRAVIVHEKADDFSQPLGNAGGRIGCGIIAVSP